ncbi:imidazole glycerol phosphate synthase subunit HisH [Alicyclobacillus acidocaldarius]|uniref:Imidazole glycerol phosphate synthase subunit HisH n=1 Tax=Alicyclobacillus acidocaldarius (strain Tc-4-1) TaxID=1048834 RepID=F8IFI8_ALIAT|nr:imidazole glycerol phosphate synthase subunit HisH [Alicyclobacillus acidocaldarius]AEJ42890.1 imidazole glycerol phosphate synthase, glutamine amidotransferase subunit [Alicyclobacillus acidocaldarius subsp. acidocaldarius Tc-4-1]
MIIVLDPGIGNLHSVLGGLRRVGSEGRVVASRSEWEAAMGEERAVQGVILPGVGAFGDAMSQMRLRGLCDVVRDAVARSIPLLGICLGMQLLFTSSEEHGVFRGLDLVPGHVVRFPDGAKVPHMGWNSLEVRAPRHPLLRDVREGDYVYFVHSYYAVAERGEDVIASTSYAGVDVPAVVARVGVMGTQFHPEKSGPVGERILANFVRIAAYPALLEGVRP